AEAQLLAGRAPEVLGQPELAMSRYETASQVSPLDPRPLEALETLAERRGDWDFVAELLGRQILHCTTPAARAALWLRRARLYRDVLGREPEAYRCLKEAFANDPTLSEASQALR